jgi:hypothetical protein
VVLLVGDCVFVCWLGGWTEFPPGLSGLRGKKRRRDGELVTRSCVQNALGIVRNKSRNGPSVGGKPAPPEYLTSRTVRPLELKEEKEARKHGREKRVYSHSIGKGRKEGNKFVYERF